MSNIINLNKNIVKYNNFGYDMFDGFWFLSFSVIFLDKIIFGWNNGDLIYVEIYLDLNKKCLF